MEFKIFGRLPGGEQVHVATRKSREDAEWIAKSFAEHWPGDYTIEETGDPGEQKQEVKLSGASSGTE